MEVRDHLTSESSDPQEERAARNRYAGAALLLRKVVQKLDPRASGDRDEVVLETDFDGVRYTLVRHAVHQPDKLPELSAREQEIARMIGKGYTNKTIALVLDISSWTVDTHIRRIFAKLGVRSRSAMVARLARAQTGVTDDTPEWPAAWRSQSHGRLRSG